MLEVDVCTANTTKDHTKQVLNTTGMNKLAFQTQDRGGLGLVNRSWSGRMVGIGTRKKLMLEVDVCTANTTKDHTKQVLNTTGMNKLAFQTQDRGGLVLVNRSW